ncbi:Uncharacterised protein [Candidatus Bilamarchaeum dharawalense]|uniref:Uncharacterized protein n=1 Tax=Candidatus Bilamarchaeum dharawalense TaxID=2885759 RepID=A0A5E4LSA5_9ARCH|nr:Uncharacterised protein [Candidatus Bilamarchaeum dharawalense]
MATPKNRTVTLMKNDRSKKKEEKLEPPTKQITLDVPLPTTQAQPPQTQSQKPPLTPEQLKAQEEMNATVKEIENAMYALRFYPVAANEEAKNKAVEKLDEIYSKGNETIKQLMLYMIHENLAASSDLKIMHTYDYFKMKNPTLDPGQTRINVYRAMFNYHTSIEGLVEMVNLLGRMQGDDAAKLLTYHFSHLCAYESEANHMIRASILEALGNSESLYALRALLNYAKYNDNDRTFGRVVSALILWDKKMDKTKMTDHEKQAVRTKMKEYMNRDQSENHYG